MFLEGGERTDDIASLQNAQRKEIILNTKTLLVYFQKLKRENELKVKTVAITLLIVLKAVGLTR